MVIIKVSKFQRLKLGSEACQILYSGVARFLHQTSKMESFETIAKGSFI